MAEKFNPENIFDEIIEGMPDVNKNTGTKDNEAREKTPKHRVKVKQELPARVSKSVNFSCYIDDSILASLKAISAKENITLRSIIECGAELFIQAYIAKHGKPPRIQARKKGEAKDLL